MSVLNRIAAFQGRRDEAPNQELARELAAARDSEGIREIAVNLWHKDKNIHSDCLKVLYEIGYLDPELIAPYVADFIKLLQSSNNRMVWGSLIALATITPLQSTVIYGHVTEIQRLMQTGTVITIDNGVKILASLAAGNPERNRRLFPYLIKHLETCRNGDVPRHAEYMLPAVNARNQDQFSRVLQTRMQGMSGAQMTRIRKVLKRFLPDARR